jgi:hypothetical protein
VFAVIGDSRTADRADGQTPWPMQVTEVAMINAAVPGYVWSQCVAATPAQDDRLVVQCGVNDILADADGATLWATVETWLGTRAGKQTWVMNIAGFKGYDATASRLAERNEFNAAFIAYCAAPAAGVTCVDIANPLKSGADSDALATAYQTDGIHYTTAGHTVVKNAFEALYP